MSEFVYFSTLGLVLGTILLVFGMRFISTIAQSRARAAGQSETAAALSSIEAMLAEVNTRLTAVEKVLKDVE